jgi:hypothetical protein
MIKHENLTISHSRLARDAILGKLNLYRIAQVGNKPRAPMPAFSTIVEKFKKLARRAVSDRFHAFHDCS